MHLFFLAVALSQVWQVVQARGPFLIKVNDTSHIIGNDLWNITIGQTYGTKLYYKNHDCVGKAVGHYVSYSKDGTFHSYVHILTFCRRRGLKPELDVGIGGQENPRLPRCELHRK